MVFENAPDLDVLASIPERDFAHIVDAIRQGVKNAGEALGFSEEALDSIERTAQAYYRTHQFAKAAVIYGFVLRLNQKRATAWRALGACAQAQKKFDDANPCYRVATELDPSDVASTVFLAECLCQVGERDEGIRLLRSVIEAEHVEERYRPYLTRARAIVAQDGGIPNTILLRRQGEALFQEASQEIVLSEAAAVGMDADALDREIEFSDIRRNPRLVSAIRELARYIEDGRLSYAQVGGFTDDEMDGAYAVACQYAQVNEVAKAIQIAGYLIFLDPRCGRYYQLVGICLQRMKQYEGADFYYRMAEIFAPGDAMTQVYRGECLIMSGKVDAGLRVVAEGRDLAAQNQDGLTIVNRADVLLKQFGALEGNGRG